MLAFIVGLRAEARLLKPLTGKVYVGGGTTRGAADAARRALGAGATALVSFGLAGGLSPEIAAGALIVPSAVLFKGRHLATDPELSAALGGVNARALLAGDAVVASIAGKAERWHGTNAEAVDLESGAVAEAARQASVPYAVLRAVCDPATRALPPAAVGALTKGGGIGFVRLARSLVAQPGQLGALLALSRDAAAARRALVGRVRELRESGALAAWLARGGGF